MGRRVVCSQMTELLVFSLFGCVYIYIYICFCFCFFFPEVDTTAASLFWVWFFYYLMGCFFWGGGLTGVLVLNVIVFIFFIGHDFLFSINLGDCFF